MPVRARLVLGLQGGKITGEDGGGGEGWTGQGRGLVTERRQLLR